MQLATKICVFLIGSLGLAGCETTTDESFAFGTTFNSFAELEAALAPASSIVDPDGIIADNDTIAGSGDFPTTGTTSYNGAILAQEQSDGGEGRTLVGQLQLDVAFNTATIEGTAGNFFLSESSDSSISEVGFIGTLTGNGTYDRLAGASTVDSGFDPHFTDLTLAGGLASTNGDTYTANVTLNNGYFLNNASSVDTIAGIAEVTLGGDAPEFDTGAFAVKN